MVTPADVEISQSLMQLLHGSAQDHEEVGNRLQLQRGHVLQQKDQPCRQFHILLSVSSTSQFITYYFLLFMYLLLFVGASCNHCHSHDACTSVTLSTPTMTASTAPTTATTVTVTATRRMLSNDVLLAFISSNAAGCQACCIKNHIGLLRARLAWKG